jgi:solute:Na+ symporter, SSS family
MRPLDLIVIAAYVAGLVGIGVRFAVRQRSTEQYFVAGRSIPGWANCRAR